MKLNKEGLIEGLDDNEVFVFGSNMNGFHYGGVAQQALLWGALPGVGVGRQGKTYAIPTLDTDMSKLPLETIREHLCDLIEYAKKYPNTKLLLTKIGQGVAGFSAEEIESITPKILPDNIIRV